MSKRSRTGRRNRRPGVAAAKEAAAAPRPTYADLPWSADDDARLGALVAATGTGEWHEKAKALGGRAPNDVWTRWFRHLAPDCRCAQGAGGADDEGEQAAKRPKVDGPATAPAAATKRAPKKKVALMLGFLGAEYQGFQRNPGAKTLEDAIEQAIYSAGGILPSNFGDLRKISWTRSARTDKGVSAAACCVGMNLVLVRPLEAMRDAINRHLPADIRLHSITPTTGGFDAKNQCNARRYEYLLPTYALLPPGAPVRADGRVPPDELRSRLASLREVLKNFCGTHWSVKDFPSAFFSLSLSFFFCTNELLKKFSSCSFANYSVRVKHTEAAAQRYVISFVASDPEVIGGLEVVACTVVGQSFLMHMM